MCIAESLDLVAHVLAANGTSVRLRSNLKHLLVESAFSQQCIWGFIGAIMYAAALVNLRSSDCLLSMSLAPHVTFPCSLLVVNKEKAMSSNNSKILIMPFVTEVMPILHLKLL